MKSRKVENERLFLNTEVLLIDRGVEFGGIFKKHGRFTFSML